MGLLAFFGVNYEKVKIWIGMVSPKPQKPPEEGEEKLTVFKFDIAISFAGEDRKIAKNLAKKLGKKKIQNRKVKVLRTDRTFPKSIWTILKICFTFDIKTLPCKELDRF